MFPAQQPFLHGLPAPQLVAHVCVVVSHASFAGQSLVLLHPHVPPGRHTGVLGVLVQFVHVPPLGPQALSLIAAHVPPLQQKPVPHVPSPLPPHSLVQLFPPLQVGVLPEHTWHAPPLLPQASLSPPATQVVPLQQPVLHASPPAHDVVHWWLTGVAGLVRPAVVGAVAPARVLHALSALRRAGAVDAVAWRAAARRVALARRGRGPVGRRVLRRHILRRIGGRVRRRRFRVRRGVGRRLRGAVIAAVVL
jgi:hypothetical protein